MTAIDHLLVTATTLRRAQELVGEQPGARFNIFQLLGMESDEVYTHSMLLAELLNPKGSHGIGDVFLQHWLEILGIENFDETNATCIPEFLIGPVTPTTGGRIDLLIQSGKQRVIIENKIYAGDQPNQLLRYHNFEPNGALFYLTLFGAQPSEESTGKGALKPEQYTCISYADHVLNWLERCRKEAANIPTLRETISQYIFLIKQLTHQHFDGKMQDELVNKILNSPDFLTSFMAMQSRSLNQAVNDRITAKWETDLKALAEELNLNLNFYFKDKAKWHGFTLWNDQMKSMNIWIDFQFDLFPNGLKFGFSYPGDALGKPMKPAFSLEPLQRRFKEAFPGTKSHDWWPAYVYWSHYPADQVCQDIYFSDAFINRLREKIKVLQEILDAAALEIIPINQQP